jgi:hypothetical protein
MRNSDFSLCYSKCVDLLIKIQLPSNSVLFQKRHRYRFFHPLQTIINPTAPTGSGLTPQQEPNVSLISFMLQLERRKAVKRTNKNTKMAPRTL